MSQIYKTGRHSHEIEDITIKSWNEGADLFIGSFCLIASNQTIFPGGNHRPDWSTTYPFGLLHEDLFPLGSINGLFEKGGLPTTKGHVINENDVWIGEGCTIMSGVTIGSGSILAAESIVTKDVPPYMLVGGNPAKHIKPRFQKEIINVLLEISWWDYKDVAINQVCPLLQVTSLQL